jgi:hypothetical protein
MVTGGIRAENRKFPGLGRLPPATKSSQNHPCRRGVWIGIDLHQGIQGEMVVIEAAIVQLGQEGKHLQQQIQHLCLREALPLLAAVVQESAVGLTWDPIVHPKQTLAIDKHPLVLGQLGMAKLLQWGKLPLPLLQ